MFKSLFLLALPLSSLGSALALAAPALAPTSIFPNAQKVTVQCDMETQTAVGTLHFDAMPSEKTLDFWGYYDFWKGNVEDLDWKGLIKPVQSASPWAARDASVTLSQSEGIFTIEAQSWLSGGVTRNPHVKSFSASFKELESAEPTYSLVSLAIDGQDQGVQFPLCKIQVFLD